MVKIVKDVLVKSSCVLGESPMWDCSTQSLYWVDIISGQLHRFFIKNQQHEVLDLKKSVCAIARCSNGQILMAFKQELAILNDFHMDGLLPKVTLLAGNGIRFNDGKIDPNGKLWIGSMSELGEPNKGILMKIDATFKATVELADLGTSNGMCWSPDSSIFYHIDTMRQQVTSYEYLWETGSIKNPKVIIQIPKALGKPDGMTVDGQGKLWVALWGGWAVSQWDPLTGNCMQMIKLPVSLVTSCIFGGESLSDLFVTSAQIGLNKEARMKQPLAGSVFKISIPGVSGLPANDFKL